MSQTTREISVAPMMDWTDRHCRYFHRLLSPHARLYTEMITTGALIHGDRERFLRFDEAEHPIALQFGGSDADALRKCAVMAQDSGYDEINLNCGCPSDRVQQGSFGACLMKQPDLVSDCVAAMQSAVDIPVTVKCRIGIDKIDDAEFLDEFVEKIADKGCKTFIIHARNAWLNGLSPKDNRNIPPLNYDRVYALKEKYPHLRIIINGGVKDISDIRDHLQKLDGVMIGREAYQNPWLLTEIEKEIFENKSDVTRESIALKMRDYAKEQKRLYDTPVKSIARHVLGLYHEQPNGKTWRRVLSTLPYEDGADESVFERALEAMEESKMAA